MTTDQAGRCQACGAVTTAYSTPTPDRSVLDPRTRVEPPTLTAEPCGHEQPRPPTWPALTPTYPQ